MNNNIIFMMREEERKNNNLDLLEMIKENVIDVFEELPNKAK